MVTGLLDPVVLKALLTVVNVGSLIHVCLLSLAENVPLLIIMHQETILERVRYTGCSVTYVTPYLFLYLITLSTITILFYYLS